MQIPTISIDTDNGPVQINQSDYNPDTHTLTDPQPEWSALFGNAAPVPTAPPAAPAPTPMAPLEPPAQPVPPANVDTAAVPVAPPPAPNAPTPPPAPLAPVETFVTKLENAWFIVDEAGKPIDGKNGEDGKGFSTKKAAEEANK